MGVIQGPGVLGSFYRGIWVLVAQGCEVIWGFPKIRGTFLGSILGSPYFEKLPYRDIGCCYV